MVGFTMRKTLKPWRSWLQFQLMIGSPRQPTKAWWLWFRCCNCDTGTEDLKHLLCHIKHQVLAQIYHSYWNPGSFFLWAMPCRPSPVGCISENLSEMHCLDISFCDLIRSLVVHPSQECLWCTILVDNHRAWFQNPIYRTSGFHLLILCPTSSQTQ